MMKHSVSFPLKHAHINSALLLCVLGGATSIAWATPTDHPEPLSTHATPKVIPNSPVSITETKTTRPKIGLALSGGGARGLAHIGILRELEKRHIPIDYIAGTSAGALIGGMYASGMSLDDIEQKIRAMDFEKILYEPATNRTEQTQLTRDLEYQGNGILDVSVSKDGAVALPKAVINGTRVEESLRSIFKNYPHQTNFDRLPIPFRAVATDLASGKKVVLNQGVLAQALRASMSIPAVFAPVEIEGQLLTDGMVASNLPIEVVRQMGAQRIIAVNVGSGLLPKEQLNSVLGVSGQLLSILVERNVADEVRTLKPQDVYIHVDVGTVGNLEFNRLDESIKYGQKAFNNIIDKKTRVFSISSEQYQLTHKAPPIPTVQHIDFVRVQTNGLANPESLRQRVARSEGRDFSMERINQDISDLLKVDRIESVRYEVLKVGDAGDKNELIYHVQEKDIANNVIRAGIDFSGNSLTQQNLALHLAHRRVWLNSWGGEWRTYMTLGKTSEIKTLFNQPVSINQNWFIRPQVSATFENNSAYLKDKNSAASDYNLNRQNVALMIGRTISTKGEWSIGTSWTRAQNSQNLNNPNLPIYRDKMANFTIDAEATIDQLDSLFIPTQGYFLRAYARINPMELDKNNYRQAGLQSVLAKRWGQHALANQLEVGGHNNSHSVYLSPYRLGGYHRLSGYEPNQLIGNYMAMNNLSYRYITPWKLLNDPLILGASVEAGNTWERIPDISLGKLKASGSLFGAINTPIGPLQLGMGVTRKGHANFYLYLGRTFTDW